MNYQSQNKSKSSATHFLYSHYHYAREQNYLNTVEIYERFTTCPYMKWQIGVAEVIREDLKWRHSETMVHAFLANTGLPKGMKKCLTKVRVFKAKLESFPSVHMVSECLQMLLTELHTSTGEEAKTLLATSFKVAVAL